VTAPTASPGLFATLADIRDVEGWLSEDQAVLLWRCACQLRPGSRIVEIGSFRGRSAIVLARASESLAKEVVAIDPHAGNDRGPQEFEGFEAEAADDHQIFLDNLQRAGVRDRVRHLRMFSDAALGHIDRTIDVLYIDGAHRFAPALADIRNYGERVSDGGAMLIHDSFSSIGVTGAIMRELAFGRRFRYVGRSRSMTIFRADLAGSGTGRIGNAGRQLAQLPWFARNVALKVLLSIGLGKVLARLGRPVPDWPY
jgi:predicted O-methyltransferase YrrM